MTRENPLILLGVALGAFGVRGEIRVKSFTAAPEDICAYGGLLDNYGRLLFVPASCRVLKDTVAITAVGNWWREKAELVRGNHLFVLRNQLPEPAEDEFYAADLIGCRVENLDGAALGEVMAVPDYGAGDILEIALNGAIWRLPFTKENAPKIDLKAGLIVVDPPEGLLPE